MVDDTVSGAGDNVYGIYLNNATLNLIGNDTLNTTHSNTGNLTAGIYADGTSAVNISGVGNKITLSAHGDAAGIWTASNTLLNISSLGTSAANLGLDLFASSTGGNVYGILANGNATITGSYNKIRALGSDASVSANGIYIGTGKTLTLDTNASFNQILAEGTGASTGTKGISINGAGTYLYIRSSSNTISSTSTANQAIGIYNNGNGAITINGSNNTISAEGNTISVPGSIGTYGIKSTVGAVIVDPTSGHNFINATDHSGKAVGIDVGADATTTVKNSIINVTCHAAIESVGINTTGVKWDNFKNSGNNTINITTDTPDFVYGIISSNSDWNQDNINYLLANDTFSSSIPAAQRVVKASGK